MNRKKNPPPLSQIIREQELEPFDRENLLNRITSRIRQSLDLSEILTTTVEEIRGFLGSDRVKIYRFCADGSGEVIAESIKGSCLPSLLGLRFPASDIPPQARDLFIKARQRVIVDVESGQKTLNQLDCPQTGASLLTEDIRYFPVDECHREYLQVMGVASSLVVPILHQNGLWGLLVAHHSKPFRFSEQELNVVQMLVDQVSIAIAQSNLLSQARLQAHHESIINQISCLLHSPLQITEIRQSVLEETVKALQGSGGRLYICPEPTGKPAQLYTCGQQPNREAWIEESSFWRQIIGSSENSYNRQLPIEEDSQIAELLSSSSMSLNVSKTGVESSNKESEIPNFPYIIADVYRESQIDYLVPAFRSTKIHSILIVPLRYRQQCVGCFSIFRNEIETDTLWAGHSQNDSRNLRPRNSFAAWREIKKGQAPEWNTEEIRLAHSLSIHLYMAVMQRRVEDMIRHQASHDHLTGLPNRLLFDDRLSLALASAQQRGEILAVVFLDLDFFKTINDTLGHAVGDQLLQTVAKRLSSCLREGDLVARWGGDEFTLLLCSIHSTEAAGKIAERILDTLNVPFHFNAQELHVKASIGIALAPYDGQDAETLLKNADAAMYRAKQLGRNNYQLYTPSIGTQALERLVLENKLYKALERNEFLLHYQPQVDLKTGQIIAMEALIRWQSAELGFIAPYQFIPIAEETGLICPIGEWVLRTACAQNRLWQELGLPPLRIAVNLSARQLQQDNLVSTIEQILQETQMEPSYLELEITESVAMQDMKLTISVLHQLRKMGIQISMDDFGTGYSSLSSLKHFPLNTLKIDRSFVSDLMSNPHDAAIIKAILALGHGLNLKVIAEGVETKEQLVFLRLLNCDGFQGFLFSKPLPSDGATQMLRG